MTLNDLEPLPFSKSRGFSVILQLTAAEHVSRKNCAEITKNGSGQPAYEIFSIERTPTF